MAAPSANTLTGVLERIIFFNEENHYTIAELRPETAKSAEDRVTIVGPLPGVQCGETLELTGEWTKHTQHGAQFKIAGFKSELPSSVYGIRKYLGSGLVPGIGKVYANKIVDAFGTDTFRVLSEESGKLRKVPGIGKVRATAIKAAWDEQKTLREVHIYLQTYGVTTSQCVKIVNKFGVAAPRVLREEPYRIAREIDGIGFKTADRLAINLGFANDSAPRLDAGLIYALETLQEDGHTAYLRDELVTYAANLLETSAERLESRIDALVAEKTLAEHGATPSGDAAPPPRKSPERGEGAASPATPPSSTPHSALRNPRSFIQLLLNSRAEEKIASVVGRLTRHPSGLPPIKVDAAVAWAQEKAGFEFHALQAAALKNALAHKFSILTGGPGTGKTSILRALVAILKAKRVRVTLAAPTGRAAQRLAETTGGFASTIHRLLKFENGAFTVNESHPLATDFLIVDEASMLDTRLAAALLQAVPNRAHLLLVGDIDQLPSVGAGNVLKDLIAVSALLAGDAAPSPRSLRSVGPASAGPARFATQPGPAEAGPTPAASTSDPPSSVLRPPSSALPVTRLSFVYRQGKESAIVTTAHAINEGHAQPPPVLGEVAVAQAWSDLNFIAASDAEDCLAKVIELCTGFIPAHFKWLNPIADVQVLAPMHKGTVGVANLNLRLQEALRPWKRGAAVEVGAAVPSGAKPFARDAAPRPHAETPAHGIRTLNGTFEVGDKLIQLRNNYDKGLFNGDIGTVVSTDLTKGTLIADFDGERHVFERGEMHEVALAYAISIHKCVAADTWLLTARGWRQIADLWPANETGTCVRPLRLRLAGESGMVTTDQIYRGPTEPALRVVTRHGYELTGSHRHPLRVYDPATGSLVWKKMPDLRLGDYLPIRRAMSVFPAEEVAINYRPVPHFNRRTIPLPRTLNPDVARILGYLVGDGSYDERRDGDVRLTNADRPLVRDYTRILKRHFGLQPALSRSTAPQRAPTWYVISRTFREWLLAAGLEHATARRKKVPRAVLSSPRDVQAAFLRGLFDTDGSASGKGTRVVLATASRQLADHVRMMLLNFGIVTALLHIKVSDSWRVELYGSNLHLFEAHIGFGLAGKARQLRRMVRRSNRRRGRTNVDVLPQAAMLWRQLLSDIRYRLGPTKGRKGCGLFTAEFRPQAVLIHALARQAFKTNYRHLAELLPALQRRWPWARQLPSFGVLQQLLDHHLFFDPIRRIESCEAEMFDLHVPTTHAFFSNGFISHNSQGSEYPVVIVPLLKAHFMMLQRNLVYTAITRGKRKVFLVGEPAAYSMAVRNAESKTRCTHLREKILTP